MKPPSCARCAGEHRTELCLLPRRAADIGTVFAEANEHGWECPRGHREVVFSEFLEHLWCEVCKDDYPTRLCPVTRPNWRDEKEFLAWLAKLPFRPLVKPGVVHLKDIPLMGQSPSPSSTSHPSSGSGSSTGGLIV